VLQKKYPRETRELEDEVPKPEVQYTYASKFFDLDVACNRVGVNRDAWKQKSDGKSLEKSRGRWEQAIKMGCEPVRRMKRAQNAQNHVRLPAFVLAVLDLRVQ
jgi:hypothetical protein